MVGKRNPWTASGPPSYLRASLSSFIMVDDYYQAVALDLFTVVCCVGALLRFGGIRFMHPATPYIVFHIHTVTSRLLGLMNGARTLFSDYGPHLEPVAPFEIVRAALYCDEAFWMVTAVWIVMHMGFRIPSRPNAMKLDLRILRPLLGVAFVGGIAGLVLVTQIPGLGPPAAFTESSSLASSSYILILPSWFGLAVLGHVYYRGFGRVSTILVIVYLVLMALQGSQRFRVIIGLLLAVQIWVELHDRRWPSRTITLVLLVSGALFFPMKVIATTIQTGDEMSQAYVATADQITEVSKGAALDQMFLDEFACGLTLLDMQGKLYWGEIYLPLITLPIPRAIWPNKPTLAGFVYDISSRHRPMGTSGMITTYLGEAYANFGPSGIVIVSPILAFLLALFYRAAIARPHDSILRLAYTLVSVNLIQIYRDGLQSLVIFTFVNMMPLVIIVFAHVLVPFLTRRRPIGQRPPIALAMPPIATGDAPSAPSPVIH